MIDLIIYGIFSYIILGSFIVRCNNKEGINIPSLEWSISFIAWLFAPIMMPFIFGLVIAELWEDISN
jgi:hypothetical protein